MRSPPRVVYMIRRGAAWVRDPALAGAGFQFLSFRTRKAAQAWMMQHHNPYHRVEKVWLRIGGL